MAKRFNLNADMAEGYGPWQMGDDKGLLSIIGSANIACGFHAGDYNIMGQVMRWQPIIMFLSGRTRVFMICMALGAGRCICHWQK